MVLLKIWIIFLVDSNGNNILNADNEPIILRMNLFSQIGVVKNTIYKFKKIGDNTFQ